MAEITISRALPSATITPSPPWSPLFKSIPSLLLANCGPWNKQFSVLLLRLNISHSCPVDITSCLMAFFCDMVQQSKVVFFFLCNVILLSVYFQSCIDECLYRAYCKGLREWYKRRRQCKPCPILERLETPENVQIHNYRWNDNVAGIELVHRTQLSKIDNHTDFSTCQMLLHVHGW